MRIVEKFICEVCGTEYEDDKKCQECERNHCKVKKIIRSNYQPVYADPRGLPESIDIELDTGVIVRYRRSSAFSDIMAQFRLK